MEARLSRIDKKIGEVRRGRGFSELDYVVVAGGLSKDAKRRVQRSISNPDRLEIRTNFDINSVAEEFSQDELERINESLRRVSGQDWADLDEGRFLIMDWFRGPPDNFPTILTPLGGLTDKSGKVQVLFKFVE
ncbi:hypothetical protein A2382_01410 [Candidatus Woesebacteria bacterium RIFOXYB1_FULL_38_16]|uniref:Uncharacterized protein n=1 Tax=Candidatus Woesebacteria bacterium RIFOXYB1_FULL_38_16 TaxID=1802538 RepID=A0A1F8CU16_9BACT|nr:MAG: hypothetical protein A2191_01830 [Candidatus Woesebacteria bacterium RIFOXYA1_FULL_38_9]OGM79055.1 MAG: hypothetical protein A2382_01410 [Candidatus Woesebacteria bacterium RIFOXYB1_FULL_38_16]